MFNRSAAKNKSDDSVVSIRPKPAPVGRERLMHFDAEIGKARVAITDLEQRVERLGSIIIEGDVAHRALQTAIAADGGKALERYAAGLANDDEIAKLVMKAENTARAATAAKAALPTAQASLQNAGQQLVALGEQRAAELNRVLSLLGDEDARAYRDAFNALCIAHDRLVGFAAVAQMSHGDIQLAPGKISVPRFVFPSLASSIDADPMMHHVVSSLTANESGRQWSEVRVRLEADATADISDIIKG
jgi:hypothetical protein